MLENTSSRVFNTLIDIMCIVVFRDEGAGC